MEKKYKIYFEYFIAHVWSGETPRCTRAVIECRNNEGSWTSVATGEATCSFQDRFVKETGRRIALHRAVEEAKRNTELSKADVAAIYSAYFNRKRGGGAAKEGAPK